MIYYGGMRQENLNDYLIFFNDLNEKIEVPIERGTARLISAYIDKLKSEKENNTEYLNDEPSE